MRFWHVVRQHDRYVRGGGGEPEVMGDERGSRVGGLGGGMEGWDGIGLNGTRMGWEDVR